MTTEFELLVSQSPDPSVFTKPMSKKARKLLTDVLKWAHKWCMSKPGMIDTVMSLYSRYFIQLAFEEAVYAYDTGGYIKAIKSKKPNSLDCIFSIMGLDPLRDEEWLTNNNIPRLPPRIGSLSRPGVQEVYSWLVNNFLYTDFNENDVDKIVEMGITHGLNLVKKAAAEIIDLEKKTVPYLYAVVSSMANREKVTHKRAVTEQRLSNNKFKAVYDLYEQSKNKQVHEIDKNIESKWETLRGFVDILRKLK